MSPAQTTTQVLQLCIHSDRLCNQLMLNQSSVVLQALAYAVARLPSSFASSHRIFKELAVRYPGFEPKTMLDFGAGQGTAMWAAQEVSHPVAMLTAGQVLHNVSQQQLLPALAAA